MADALKPTPSMPGRGIQGRGRSVTRQQWWVVLLLAGFVGLAALRTARAEDKPKANQLLFLVARSPVLDPFFSRSVVLMLPLASQPVIVGLVVNKPTRVSLQHLFPDSPALKNNTDMAYLGGPVDMSVPALVFHSHKAPKDALPLYDDVFLSFDGKFIEKLLQDPKQTGQIRLFLGRAQWAPEQLQGEASEGSWYSLRAEGEVIFDHDTESLWKRLHERAKPPVSTENLSLPLPNWRLGALAMLLGGR